MANRFWVGPLGLILGLGWAPSASAWSTRVCPALQDESPAQKALDALIEEFDNAMNAFREKYFGAQTDEERQKAYEDHYPDPTAFFPRFLAVAEADPGSDPAAQALVWIVQNDRGDSDVGKQAREYLRNDYLMHPKIGAYCDTLQGQVDADAIGTLRTILSENPAPAAQGAAAFALAKCLMQQAELAEKFKDGGSPQERSGYEGYYGKEAIAALANANPAALRREGEALMERVVKEFPQAEGTYGNYAESARGELFEIRNLQVGMVAPDISGEDIDGQNFKLSDYRGKVVLLDFWGHW